ncbi:MAG: flagellar hook-basal body complex protein FliE [Steroidobacteraceae bacterium]
MSQMEIDRVLAQIRTISTQVKRPQAPAAGVGEAAAAAGRAQGPDGFAALMKRGIEQVNAAQQSATQTATAFQRGVPGVELPQVMLEMQKASVSFRAATEVRNRLVGVYQEIMNMPI